MGSSQIAKNYVEKKTRNIKLFTEKFECEIKSHKLNLLLGKVYLIFKTF